MKPAEGQGREQEAPRLASGPASKTRDGPNTCVGIRLARDGRNNRTGQGQGVASDWVRIPRPEASRGQAGIDRLPRRRFPLLCHARDRGQLPAGRPPAAAMVI
jgi:hypothetical protein